MISSSTPIDLRVKEKKFREILKSLERVIVGYSGGVDSALVAKIATEELGVDALIVISDSPSLPRSELQAALKLSKEHNFNLRVIHTREAEKEAYLANPNNRCFYCKTELYSDMNKIKDEEGYHAILDGANLNDLGDFRPGRQAASERGTKSILIEAGFSKVEVRQLAKVLGLSNFDKPAAACLSSRIPYGTHITLDKLSKIEKGEDFLKSLGLKTLRVRYHNEVARIETPKEEFDVILENAEKIYDYFQSIGFLYIALDLKGFRSGSMNEAL